MKDVKQVGRELGVRYILEGSVRKTQSRARVTAQLIDVASGTHISAERYDRDLDDIFAVQDEITQAIVAAVDPELGDVERDRAIRKVPDTLDAWEAYQRGLWHLYRFTKDDTIEAKRLFSSAIEIDPNFAACALGQLGEIEAAKTALDEVFRLKSDFSLDFVKRVLPTKDPDDLTLYLEGLRKAGLRG